MENFVFGDVKGEDDFAEYSEPGEKVGARLLVLLTQEGCVSSWKVCLLE